ncbi:MAG: MBL fold metallo-hydrolase [Rhodospirillales bacterium]|nr:MBL fold metallo-hydrolase [Rhodospirillales bacterium]
MDLAAHDQLFERLWSGEAAMEEWSAAVAGGFARSIGDDVIAIHTGYLFGNATAIRTAAGLVLIDTGSRETASQTLAILRDWDDAPVHTVIYTHGHIDHTWGARLLDAEADARGVARPHIIAHRNVLRRFARYDATAELNSLVMGRQFNQPGYTFPGAHRRPDQIYDDALGLAIGGRRLELTHCRGETDDATFVWLPDRRLLISGDFVIWVFPNAGNPRKVQRYAPDWAAALRRMQALEPAVLVPGHGPVIMGAPRVGQVLDDGAAVLESLCEQTLALMNAGRSLNDILHAVAAPREFLAKPYLLAKYDDPEFVVRHIWHLYAGWFDGNPAHLKPAPAGALAGEIAALAGGTARLARRAELLAETGQTRLAAHLIELAAAASPEDTAVQATRAAIYARCMAAETSLIGRAIFATYQREAAARASPSPAGVDGGASGPISRLR